MVTRNMDYLFQRGGGVWMMRDTWQCRMDTITPCSGLMLVTPEDQTYQGLLDHAEHLSRLAMADQELVVNFGCVGGGLLRLSSIVSRSQSRAWPARSPERSASMCWKEARPRCWKKMFASGVFSTSLIMQDHLVEVDFRGQCQRIWRDLDVDRCQKQRLRRDLGRRSLRGSHLCRSDCGSRSSMRKPRHSRIVVPHTPDAVRSEHLCSPRFVARRHLLS